ncbi:MAG: MerR family transcriptional regulator [Acidobacteriota bacterium]|nr:MerR family transcriptional regulator [Acidobacteriota bacterium]MDH3786075.1 MerR family transcriptional regulator [Acidobacteriota bacterium]
MKMKALESASGVPRSRIHFYLREGILPPAEKTARNAASYGEHHLRILKAIGRIRELGVQLPVVLLKRVAELIGRGVEPEVAIELERAVVGNVVIDGSSEPLTASSLAKAARVPLSFVRKMIEARLLVPIPGPVSSFDATDIRMVRMTHSLVEATGMDLGVTTRISDTVRDLSRYEMALRNQAVTGRDDDESAELTLRFQEAVHVIHGYLFYRWRLHDIAELRQQEGLEKTGETR